MNTLFVKNQSLIKPLLNNLFTCRQAASLLAKTVAPKDDHFNRQKNIKKTTDNESVESSSHFDISERDFLANRKALAKRFSIEQEATAPGKPSSTSGQKDPAVIGYLKRHRDLAKSQMNPIHLAILDEAKAERIAKSVIDKAYRESTIQGPHEKVFVEMQPGVGLVTKHLIENLLARQTASRVDDARFVLIESMPKYLTYLEDLKKTYENQIDVDIFKARPFEFDFMYKISPKTREIIRAIRRPKKSEDGQTSSQTSRQCIFLGVLPWNRTGFLSKLFSDFASDRCFFRLANTNDAPHEFVIYIPELVMAKLMPDSNPNYIPFRSALSVYASQFLKSIEVLEESTTGDFYPYPILKTPHKYSKHPYSQLDLNKMHLIRMVFKAPDEEFSLAESARRDCENEPHQSDLMPTVSSKYLFYLFVQEIYQRPKYTVIKVLKDIFKAGKHFTEHRVDLGMKDHEYIANLCSDSGINCYSAVKKLNPHQCMQIFRGIVDNSKTSSFLNYLTERGRSSPASSRSDERERKSHLKALMASNQDMSGRLVIPSKALSRRDDEEKALSQRPGTTQ